MTWKLGHEDRRSEPSLVEGLTPHQKNVVRRQIGAELDEGPHYFDKTERTYDQLRRHFPALRRTVSDKDAFFANSEDGLLIRSAAAQLASASAEAMKKLHSNVKIRHPEVNWQHVKRVRDKLSHIYFDMNPIEIWESAAAIVPRAITQLEEGPEQTPSSVERAIARWKHTCS